MTTTLKCFAASSVFFFSLNLAAQSDEMNVTLNELNGSYAGSYQFSVNGEDQLEVVFFNESGRFRQDVVYLDFLAVEMVTFNSDEKVVTIRCAEEGEKCIDKEIFKLDVVRHSSRIGLKEEDQSKAEETIALLQKIIALHIEQEKERESQLGETRRKR